MKIQIGAKGELDLYVSDAGDIMVVMKDSETLSDQSAQVALHPAALSASLIKLVGGSATAASVVNFIVPALVALLPKGQP